MGLKASGKLHFLVLKNSGGKTMGEKSRTYPYFFLIAKKA